MARMPNLKAYWKNLQRGRPGRRFQDRYERAKAERRGRPGVFGRVVKIVAGIGAILIAIVEIVLPGPAFVFFFIGGALLATESLVAARAMDWMEVAVRKLWDRLRKRVKRRSARPRGRSGAPD